MVTMDLDGRGAEGLDEVRYSRLIHAIGSEAVERLAAGRVLLLGCRGLGAEVGKNLALSGVASIGLVDDSVVSFEDLGVNMLLREADLGCSRAAAAARSLRELSGTVDVAVISEAAVEASLKDFQVVVATTGSSSRLAYIDRVCRTEGVMFIAALSRGVFSYAFVDLGDSFSVVDETGEASVPTLIESITQEFPATVSVVEEQKHGLEDEDEVSFSGIIGMDELNQACYPVTVTGPRSFTIPVDTRSFGRYVSGGYIQGKKRIKKLSFSPLEKAVLTPDLSCVADSSRAMHLHVAFQAVDEFEKLRGYSHISENDLEEVLKLARDMWHRSDILMRGAHQDTAPSQQCSSGEAGPSTSKASAEIDEELVKLLLQSGTVELCPVVAITGGVAAQEVIKALTGVFTPLRQWWYFDAVECLPSWPLSVEERSASGSRYDFQSAVFGRDFQSKLENSRWLVVGAGGIGSEVLKNLVLMGVGCGANGRIIVTDRDVVSKPNLVDQSLYHADDLNRPKAPTAARALRRINPAADIRALQEFFDTESESVFDSTFFEAITGVFSAVDTSSARFYIDMRCVNSRRPMIDGGKHGTKGSVQVFVPFQSEMYASTRDPPEHREIQICTLRNFPYATEHTVQWAVDTFDALFKQRPVDVNSYLSNREFQDVIRKSPPSSRLPILETLRDALVRQRPLSFDACVQWARLQFEDLFSNNIKQLLFNFPAGMATSAGTPFWSGTKRIPSPLSFDPYDPLHMSFIISASNLQATVYGLKGCRDSPFFIDLLQRAIVPHFEPKEGVKIAVSDNEVRSGATRVPDADAAEACDSILQELPTPASLVGYRLSPIDFEKDDECNFHADFVAAAANLRARNYGIPQTSRLQARLLGGRTIPTLATSTSVVAGLMCLEVYKLLQEKPLADYRHSYFNLALPLLCSAQPVRAIEHTVARSNGGQLTWTLWDRFEMDCVDMSLEKFLANFKQQQGLEVTMLSYGKSLLFAEFLPRKKLQDRLPMSLLELVNVVGKVNVPASETKLVFSVSCTDANDNDVEVPEVVARIK